MAKSDWWFQFEHLKWLTDENLNRCELATQGFWVRCICMMQKSGTYELSGSVKELSRLLGVFPEELIRATLELQQTGTGEITLCNADVTLCNAENVTSNTNVTLISRKIRNEVTSKELTRLRVARHRQNNECNASGNGAVTGQSKSKSNNKRKKEETKTEPKRSEWADKAQEVFKFWTEILNKPSHKFTTERKNKVIARLKDGYSVDDLKTAIQGISLSPHNMGQNDRGVEYNDLELICRTGTHVEKYRDMKVKGVSFNGQNKQNGNGVNRKLTDAEVVKANKEFYDNWED